MIFDMIQHVETCEDRSGHVPDRHTCGEDTHLPGGGRDGMTQQ